MLLEYVVQRSSTHTNTALKWGHSALKAACVLGTAADNDVVNLRDVAFYL